MIHDAASAGYSMGAETYASVRPGYHQELVERFVERYVDGPVVDVGAGTGKFTEQLDAAGVDVIAVEPVAQMRALLAERLRSVRVVPGTAESMPIDDHAANTVVAAQAFHWFDFATALDEIDRVLAPRGHLVTVWNVRDESVPWVAEYTAVVDEHAGDAPRYRTMAWRRAIDDDPRFESVDDWQVENPVPTDAEGVVARALSTSFIAALPPAEQERVGERLRAVVGSLGARFAYPYRSELQAWRRR